MQIENPALIAFGGEGTDAIVRLTDCRFGLFPQNLPDRGKEEQKSMVDQVLVHTRTRRAEVIVGN